MEQPKGQAETGSRQGWQRGLAVELMVAAVLSVVLALMVALAGSAMTASTEPSTRTLIVPIFHEAPGDLDPRDPLVRCTVFATHTHCIREES